MMATDPDRRVSRLTIDEGDITKVQADAIVNAASHSLLGYTGVSGAIFAAAGPGLREECAALNGCAAGDAKMTKAYGLSALHIIHAVGPVWYGGHDGEEETLERCYRRCLDLVELHSHRTVAFPSIGTGAHGFPIERAARIALREITSFLERNAAVERFTVICHDRATYDCYLAARDEFRDLTGPPAATRSRFQNPPGTGPRV
jgi:O-acetyl-ADP-ribose deacetylase (regulator of RNase III)